VVALDVETHYWNRDVACMKQQKHGAQGGLISH
jgi:hypothetical protein